MSLAVGYAITLGASAILAANKNSKIKGAITDIETTISDLEKERTKPMDISSFSSDTSGMLSNPYANLSVATKAAEISMQETDKALANTLDTLKASGAGAGGATALAQAALKSKQGIAASIESQEVANEKAKAAGIERLEKAKQAEAIRMQGAEIDAYKFQYGEQKEEELRQLDRQQALLDEQKAQQAALDSGVAGAIGGTLSALGTLGGMG
jgi:hypothetical protein